MTIYEFLDKKFYQASDRGLTYILVQTGKHELGIKLRGEKIISPIELDVAIRRLERYDHGLYETIKKKFPQEFI